jgi:uncharacterized protein (DUF305 family)
VIRIATTAFAAALMLGGIASAQHAGHGSHETPPQAQQDRQGRQSASQPPASPTEAAHGHAGHGAMASKADTPATMAFRDANARMHRDMDIPYTNDADIDFAQSMIPHHQGAIEMAKIVLQHGKDPELRTLAQEIVSAQEKEIAFIQDWLKRNGK